MDGWALEEQTRMTGLDIDQGQSTENPLGLWHLAGSTYSKIWRTRIYSVFVIGMHTLEPVVYPPSITLQKQPFLGIMMLEEA